MLINMEKRVVITGLGVVAPNGVGLEAFKSALKEGRSGILFDQQLADLQFSCQVSGTPPVKKENLSEYFTFTCGCFGFDRGADSQEFTITFSGLIPTGVP